MGLPASPLRLLFARPQGMTVDCIPSRPLPHRLSPVRGGYFVSRRSPEKEVTKKPVAIVKMLVDACSWVGDTPANHIDLQ